jgi:hypothetical protein
MWVKSLLWTFGSIFFFEKNIFAVLVAESLFPLPFFLAGGRNGKPTGTPSWPGNQTEASWACAAALEIIGDLSHRSVTPPRLVM